MSQSSNEKEVPTKDNVINFAKKVREKTGVVLDEEAIAAGQEHQEPRRVRVNPEEDPIAKMALEVLKIVQEHVDERPIAALAALQLAGGVLGRQFMKRFGREETSKMAITAMAVSRQYQEEVKTDV